ncbi:MAG: uroporphyrinogen-III synthase [Thiomicrorhabdus sp.]|nr:uroporphyrinogen-III synthase [Thiomicrorhabdus sp.]
MPDLVPFTLLNTRPSHQAAALSSAVQNQGGQVVLCPTIEIQWCTFENTVIDLCSGVDKIIFISVNAVQGFLNSPFYSDYLKALKSPTTSITLYAIGRATQQYGISHQLPLTVLSNTEFDSESLLAHPVMQSVNQTSILIVKGQGGRALLADTLKNRGANVQFLDVYRRSLAPFCRLNWLKFRASCAPVLLITSIESIQNLLKNIIQFDSDYAQLNHPKWSFLQATVVFSERIKTFMENQGWHGTILVVSSQSNAGIIDTLLTMQPPMVKHDNLGK